MSDRIPCSKHINEPCPREATELLLLQPPGRYGWEFRPRCDQHPADDDLTMLRAFPGTAYAIVALPAEIRIGVS